MQQPETDNSDVFNLNYLVWVKLTKEGKRVLTEYIDEAAARSAKHDGVYAMENLAAYRVQCPCVDGYTEMQGWQMIKIFGPHLSIGSGLFSMNIRLKAPIARKEDE